jgi:arylformamidase
MSPHVGTHADAPAHYKSGGATTSGFELTDFVGRVRVVDARRSELVDLAVLERGGAIGCRRVLVRVLDIVQAEKFVGEFAALAVEAAEALVDNGLRLYGTDAPSIDPVDSSRMSAHKVLGAAGVPILENLDLTLAEPGDYDLVALPLKLEAAEAAPVRAVLLAPGSLTGRD